jgi:hypothetical protein
MSQYLHVFINETKSKHPMVESFPCAECARKITPKAKFNEVFDSPVLHGIQYGKCPACQASHFIISARSEADCEYLKPFLPKFMESLSAMFAKMH